MHTSLYDSQTRNDQVILLETRFFLRFIQLHRYIIFWNGVGTIIGPYARNKTFDSKLQCGNNQGDKDTDTKSESIILDSRS